MEALSLFVFVVLFALLGGVFASLVLTAKRAYEAHLVRRPAMAKPLRRLRAAR